jgi:hypothetical protein
MKSIMTKKPKPGTRVILVKVPPELLHGLSEEKQAAISAIIGKPVLLVDYDADDRAELEFMDRNKGIHFVYVDPMYIKAAR